MTKQQLRTELFKALFEHILTTPRGIRSTEAAHKAASTLTKAMMELFNDSFPEIRQQYEVQRIAPKLKGGDEF